MRLLSADDINVRVTAAITLRALTDKDFAFAAYDTPTKRDEAIAKWNAWLAREGQTAKLNLPLKPLGAGVSYLNGNTLLAFGYSNKVVEYDPGEREVWTFDVQGAWSAEKMSSGNVLIASYTESKVIQVSPAKKVVWEFPCRGPLNARALPNGNILIAEYSGSRVVEVSPEKSIVWSFDLGGFGGDAHRLDNGNTLVSGHGSVREVTPERKTVWMYGVGICYGCQPLPGGNVLVCDYSGGKVQEVTRDKKVVWQYDAQNPVDALRLPNGNTLITQTQRFSEVTPDKKVIWSKTGCSQGRARR